MGLSTTAHYQQWRDRAAFSRTSEDKYTALWAELVCTHRLAFGDPALPFEFGVYKGLLRAYSLLSGDDEASIDRMVARAAQELVAS